jgi:hypothetical protein
MAMLRVLRLDLGSTLARPWLDLGSTLARPWVKGNPGARSTEGRMAMLRVLRIDLGSTLARPWLDLGLKASPGRGQPIGSNGNASRFAPRPWLDLGSTLARPWVKGIPGTRSTDRVEWQCFAFCASTLARPWLDLGSTLARPWVKGKTVKGKTAKDKATTKGKSKI